LHNQLAMTKKSAAISSDKMQQSTGSNKKVTANSNDVSSKNELAATKTATFSVEMIIKDI